MNNIARLAAIAALGLLASGCAGLLGGGGKVPPYLLTLTAEAPVPASIVRSAASSDAVTVEVPIVPKELKELRVPVQVTPTAIAYITGVQWADTPDRLFQQLLSETIMRTTGRVVLDPRQVALDPGVRLTGQLQRFGFDAASNSAVVVYDAALSRAGTVEARRFSASLPASGNANSIGPALNQAANQVATEVARWVGG
jgi:cholesterol transport system auxiliary component